MKFAFRRVLPLILAALSPVLLGAWVHGFVISGPPVTNSFAPLRTGGGGLVVGADLSPTGVRFLRGDVFSGYIWTTNLSYCGPQATSNSPAGCWFDVINSDSMPAVNFGVNPTTGTSQKWQRPSNYSVLEIAGAPSTSTVAYTVYANRVYVSTNVDPANPQNLTWTLASVNASGFPTNLTDNSNSATRSGGRRLAIDPANPDHVLYGSNTGGLWETKNGRSGATATWAQISTSSVPIATTNYNIAFDPANANNVYVFTNGASSGLYASTDNGATYTLVTAGGPTNAQCLVVAPTGGKVWLVAGSPGANGDVWTYSGGTGGSWVDKVAASGNEWHWVAINPNNSGTHIALLGNSGNLKVSTDSGATFGSTFTPTRAAGDAPWTAWANENFMTAGAVNFDPLNNDLLIFGGGQAVWSTALPSGNFIWTSISDGVEGGIGWSINVSQANSPIIGYQDLGSFTYNSLSNVNQSIGFPGATAQTLTFMSGVASPYGDSGFAVGNVSNDFNAQFDWSGYSTAQFQNTFFPFNTWNARVAATNIADNGSGTVRVTTSTSGLTTWSAGAGSIVCSLTTVNVATSSVLSQGNQSSCFTVNVIDATHFDLVGAAYAAGLSTTGGDYIMWTPPPTLLSSWGGTYNVIGTASSSGKIQINYMAQNFNLLLNGAPICFTGVLGTTEANGCWIAQNTATTGASGSVVLGPTSAFTNAYTGGGVGHSTGEPGGNIAAASRTNITKIAGDDAVPLCTTNGGQTWAQMLDAANLPPTQTTVVAGPYAAGTTTIQLASTSGLATGSFVHIAMDDGRDYVNSLASVSSPNITLNLAIPTGRSIATGAKVWIHSGWGFAAFLAMRQVVADTVQANTFFAVNSSAGLYKWTNCSAMTLVNSSVGTWGGNGGSNYKVKIVPGESGHLFYTSGPVGSETQNPSTNPNHPVSSGLWRTCNGDNNSAVTMQQVAGFFEPRNFGFGKAKNGSTYPAIYVEGWYDPGNVQANAVYGIWRSTDDANHGNTGSGASCSGGNTWTLINQWPNKQMPPIIDLEGDPFIYGEVYLATMRGSYFGVFN